MAQHNKTCQACGEVGHSKFYCRKRTRKGIAKRSPKEMLYNSWLEDVVRPELIARDGNKCNCCGRNAYNEEKLDIDHIKNKGAHPELKQSIRNLQLLCRYPCHRRKTDNLECQH